MAALYEDLPDIYGTTSNTPANASLPPPPSGASQWTASTRFVPMARKQPQKKPRPTLASLQHLASVEPSSILPSATAALELADLDAPLPVPDFDKTNADKLFPKELQSEVQLMALAIEKVTKRKHASQATD